MRKKFEKIILGFAFCYIMIPLIIHAQGTILEAEDGSLFGDHTRIESSVSGFSGTGYVNGFEDASDGVTVTFNLPTAGEFSLTIGFSSPYGEKDNFIDINGTRVDTVHFPELTGFSEVLLGDFTFTAGENSITFHSFWGWCILDYFKISDIAPRGNFTFTPENPATGDTISFDASGTFDPNGTIELYQWNFGDGLTATGKIVKHVYKEEGSRNVSLIITDNDGNSTQIVQKIIVARTEPYAIFSVSEEFPEPLLPVVFDGTLSFDLTGTVESWEWDFGDGNNSSESSPSHSYTDAGNYLVTLQVTNDRGKTDSKSAVIFVYPDTIIIRGPELLTDSPETFQKVELGFQVKADYINPYNPDEIMVDAVILLPSGTDSIIMPCFYFEGADFRQGNWFVDTTISNWRLRFLPSEPGDYAIKLKYSGIDTIYDSVFVVHVNEGTGKGIIRNDAENNQYYRHENGAVFYPLGINIGWNDLESYYTILQNISGYHGNFFRYWHTPFAHQALEWSQDGFYNGLGYYNPVAAAMTDSLLNLGNELDIQMQLVLFQHGMFSENVNPMWDNNPYNVANGGFVENAEEYFYNDSCKIYTRKLLRYIVARWAYSPNVFAWELFNEVQFTGIHPSQTNKWFPGVLTWHSDMSRYIESVDPYNHLITTSASDEQLLQLDTIGTLDILQYHLYSNDLLNQQNVRDSSFVNTLSKAVINGEYGLEQTADVTYNLQEISLWNSIMNEVPHIMWLWDNYNDPEWGRLFYYPAEYLKDEDFGKFDSLQHKKYPIVFSGEKLSNSCLLADSALYGVVSSSEISGAISGVWLTGVKLPYGYYTIEYYIASTDKISIETDVPLIREYNSIQIPGFNNSIAFKIKFSSEYTNPIALAGVDAIIPLGQTVALDGSASFDPSGKPITYQWTLYDKPESSSAQISNNSLPGFDFLPDVSGYYYFKLEVSNGTVSAIPDTVVVLANSRPVANAGGDRKVVQKQFINLDGSASFDADGEEITYLWKIVESVVPSNANIQNKTSSIAQFRSDYPGNYKISLTVSDNLFESIPDTINVEVLETSGISEHPGESIFLFPNPVSNDLGIYITDYPKDEFKIEIFDLYGKLVLIRNISGDTNKDSGHFNIDLSGLNSGMYYVRIALSEKFYIHSIIKE